MPEIKIKDKKRINRKLIDAGCANTYMRMLAVDYTASCLDIIDESEEAQMGAAVYAALEWRRRTNRDAERQRVMVERAGKERRWKEIMQD